MHARAQAGPQGAPPPLTGRHVVVTRPAGQAGTLAAAIRAAGGIPVCFPVLAIRALEDTRPLADLARRLEEFDVAVFISANAVEHGLGTILALRAWPPGIAVAAIGKSTERAAARFGIRDVIAPRVRFDSEALLEAPQLAQPAIRGKRVVIFRGDGGRELLGDTLVARGATVEYVTCYRREAPRADPAPLLELWARGALDAITFTSSEGLRNLWDMLDEEGRTRMRETAAFVPHPRIAEQAHALGLHDVRLTGPGDDGLLAGLVASFAPAHPHE